MAPEAADVGVCPIFIVIVGLWSSYYKKEKQYKAIHDNKDKGLLAVLASITPPASYYSDNRPDELADAHNLSDILTEMQIDESLSTMRQELVHQLFVDLTDDTSINERIRKVRRLRGLSPPPQPSGVASSSGIKRSREASPHHLQSHVIQHT